jgi:nicotinate-nucleotide adenylyltransferase
MKKVGLYFGTFNPIHVGHLIISNYMVGYTNLDEVWFVVSPLNPLKKKRVFTRRLPSAKFSENCN